MKQLRGTIVPQGSMRYCIANWKAQLPEEGIEQWTRRVVRQVSEYPDVTCAVAVPSLVLSQMRSLTEATGLKLFAQDVSAYPQGAYTGEIPAALLQHYVTGVIIGHSERRNYLHENEETLFRKVEQARMHDIPVWFCIRGVEDTVPQGVRHIVYEPVSAIGTGNPADVHTIEDVYSRFSQISTSGFGYGGSVNSKTIREFSSRPWIEGVLVGSASLKSEEFCTMLSQMR
jgi:triosephosphate isomerase